MRYNPSVASNRNQFWLLKKTESTERKQHGEKVIKPKLERTVAEAVLSDLGNLEEAAPTGE